MYAPNARVLTFIKETLLKLKVRIVPHTIIVGYFNTSISSKDRSGKHKISKDTMKLVGGMGQIDLKDIFRTLYPKSKEYTFFSGHHGIFSKSDNLISHKTGLNR